MIQVIRITGESYDLTTGEELPKSLVLSNGIEEVSVPVDEGTLQQVIRLLAAERPTNGRHQQPEEEEVFREPPVIHRVQPGPHITSTPDPDPEDYDPGEMYEESGTGVASI